MCYLLNAQVIGVMIDITVDLILLNLTDLLICKSKQILKNPEVLRLNMAYSYIIVTNSKNT